MDGRVHTVAFGASTQMTEVEHALKDCMLTGYWLVLHNAHLAEEWGPELLEFIKVISIIFCSRNKQEIFKNALLFSRMFHVISVLILSIFDNGLFIVFFVL